MAKRQIYNVEVIFKGKRPACAIGRKTSGYLMSGGKTDTFEFKNDRFIITAERSAVYTDGNILSSDRNGSIGYANTATPADVQAVWGAMEHEIIRALENGRRVSLGKLGTLRLEVGTKPGKSTAAASPAKTSKPSASPSPPQKS